MNNKFIRVMIKPRLVLLKLLDKTAFLFPDKLFLKIKYYLIMKKRLNLKNPKTYNEKLQWLKLYDRKPEYSRMVDKVEAKKYVSSIIGEEYIIPTLGVYDKFEDIDFDQLPNQFVLKCTHDSGGIFVCNDKTKIDINKAKKNLKKSLSINYFYQNREWVYNDILPRIIAEEYMVDESGYELKDYKFFCFNGEVKSLFIASERQKVGAETKFDFYDLEFNHLPFTNGHPNALNAILQPLNFDLMIKLSSKLSEGIPHIRVDFYNINGKIYFGELTFFHWSGWMPFIPEEWDYKFGSWINLSSK